MLEWFRARALNTAVALFVLAGAACGPLALYLFLTEDETPAAPLGDQPDHRTGTAGDFASLFVASWLRGDDLDFFHPNLAADDSGLLVERVSPVRSIDRGAGLFEVVVAADLIEYLAGSEEQFRPVGLRFYAVGVSADDNGDMVALGLPSQVTAPLAAPAVPSVVTEMRRPGTTDVAPLGDTLDGFFSAYLAGDGDVRLFTSPGASVAAVSPPLFGRADVFELGWSEIPGVNDPSVRLARVIVDASSPTGQQRLEYSIVVAERDGRWEVSQVLHAPVVIKEGA